MSEYKYSILSEWIRNQIKQGVFQPGDKIPTELELSKQFQLSRDTVRSGISILERDGLLSRKKGSGTYVTAANSSCHFYKTKSKKILVIMNKTENYFFPSLINGINQKLGEAGYSAAVQFTSGHFQTERHLLNHALSEDYAGILIEPVKPALPNMNLDLYRKLAAFKPTILLRSRFDLPHLSSITIDEQTSGYQLTRCLIEQGHHSIAYFCKIDEQTGVDRYQGYLQAFSSTDTKLVEDNILCFTTEDLPYLFGYPSNPRTLNILKRCTAAVCHDEHIVCRLHSFVRQQHINLSIAGFDSSDAAASICSTAVMHPQEDFGKTAACCLLHKIETPSLDTSFTFVPKLILHDQTSSHTYKSMF